MQTHKIITFFKKNSFENEAWEQNQLICGIDEVGRGCLAGPLVAAAVMLPKGCTYRHLKDSKIMESEERIQAARWIKRNCYYGYGIVHHRLIDTYNVWHATLIAMRRAVMNLLAISTIKPHAIVVDAMPLELNNSTYFDIPIYHFPFGEKKSISIAAASILAKVKRDEMMQRLDKAFPHYHWYANKGYGTPQHKNGLALHQAVIIHRVTYIQNLHLLQKDAYAYESEQQYSFF